ncbi:hypothetical protein ACRAWD_10040 [Caulobacter segnis]
MIDTVGALASGEEPMKVLTEKGGDVAKMLLKAKVDGISLVETFKSSVSPPASCKSLRRAPPPRRT